MRPFVTGIVRPSGQVQRCQRGRASPDTPGTLFKISRNWGSITVRGRHQSGKYSLEPLALRIDGSFDPSENAMKIHIWIVEFFPVLVAILRNRIGLMASLHQCCRFSLGHLLKCCRVFQAFRASDSPHFPSDLPLSDNQLIQFDFINRSVLVWCILQRGSTRKSAYYSVLESTAGRQAVSGMYTKI